MVRSIIFARNETKLIIEITFLHKIEFYEFYYCS